MEKNGTLSKQRTNMDGGVFFLTIPYTLDLRERSSLSWVAGGGGVSGYLNRFLLCLFAQREKGLKVNGREGN